jgi:acetyl-CoA carboxylase alpha subunit
METLAELLKKPKDQLLKERLAKYRSMGVFEE